ncbi:MAG: hypothetical protein IJO19_05175, partial [Clostridia bacterium]|nr:hypothetical protein [Clostridia bacterium]
METLINFKNNITELIKKNPKIIVIIGLVGIALIFLSGYFDKSDTNKESAKTKITAEEYCESLEEKLSNQIKDVVGGNVKVMITLESSIEYVYASESKNNESEVEDAYANNNQKSQKEKQIQKNFITCKDENGNEVPLVVTEIMPNVKGVVVACNNGDNDAISSAVTSLVTT